MPSSEVDARLARSRPRRRSGKRKWILGVIAIGLVAAGVKDIMPARAAEGSTAPKSYSVEFHEGQMFPTIVFPSLRGGRPGAVADFRGKKLILHIFASW